VFGVSPLGTANSFARTLGIPLDLTGAIDVLVNGKVANIDLGKINEDYFANGSSIGMPAIVGRATPHSPKKWPGRGAYAQVAAYKFIRFAPFGCIVTVNGQQTAFQALDCSDCKRRLSEGPAEYADRNVPAKQRDGALRHTEGSAPDPVASPGLSGSNDLGTFPYRWMSRGAQVNDAPRTMAKSGIAYLTSTMHDG
jgi:diacylglycerol kinase family enzyme